MDACSFCARERIVTTTLAELDSALKAVAVPIVFSIVENIFQR
jgi:hypothetical protein